MGISTHVMFYAMLRIYAMSVQFVTLSRTSQGNMLNEIISALVNNTRQPTLPPYLELTSFTSSYTRICICMCVWEYRIIYEYTSNNSYGQHTPGNKTESL